MTVGLTNADRNSLREAAIRLLSENDAGIYTKPSNGQYPHQWNWDSAVTAIGLAHIDVPRALSELSSLLSAQWDNGMVPHIVFHDPSRPYFPDASFWKTTGHHQQGLPTSGITQPPVVASALRKIAEQHDVDGFIRQWFPALVKSHRWFHETRAIDDTALATTLHPWESGTDDSLRWREVMERIPTENIPEFKRVDRNLVDSAQRPSDLDYDRFIHLVDLQRQQNWDQRQALETSPFCVQDIVTNSILLRADADLIWLGKKVGVQSKELEELYRRSLGAFRDRFWNEQRELFFDYDVRTQSSIAVNTAMTFLPLWAGVASETEAKALVVGHLRNPHEYWVEQGSGFLVTTGARNEAAWSPIRYWRGPVWVLMNWFIHGGLTRYGYTDLADRVRDDTLQLLHLSGFGEYYNPMTGEGCGARSFSWSAALTLDLLAS
jgi:glycogen debranching enzyme